VGFRFAWMVVMKAKQTIYISLNHKMHFYSSEKAAIVLIAFMYLTKAESYP